MTKNLDCLAQILNNLDIKIGSLPVKEKEGTMPSKRQPNWCYADEKLQRFLVTCGPLTDCHRHLDRQWTLDEEGIELVRTGASLMQKWEYIERIKAKPSYLKTMRPRILRAVEDMIRQGIFYCRTYIDVDENVALTALSAALHVKEEVRKRYGFGLQIAASPVKGLHTKKVLGLFREGCRLADVVGGLPSRGRKNIADYETTRQGMRTIFRLAQEFNKPLDVQIDQANHPLEKESAILCEIAQEFRERGYEQPITAVHCISLAAQEDEEMRRVAQRFHDLHINVVVCPRAAIDMRQERAVQAPVHNSITPVVELAEAQVTVGMGIDNVSDIFMPLITGNFMEELKTLACAIRRQYDFELLARIATANGREILGISS